MKKIVTVLFLLVIADFYGQSPPAAMANVKYKHNDEKPFVLYEAGNRNLEHLKYFKATAANTSLLVFETIPNDSIQIVSGGKMVKEEKFTPNSTGVRSIQPISNLKSLELIFFEEGLTEKVTITPDELKKYKFIYVSKRALPLLIELTNYWKQFM